MKSDSLAVLFSLMRTESAVSVKVSVNAKRAMDAIATMTARESEKPLIRKGKGF
jgi:hypothetical protein